MDLLSLFSVKIPSSIITIIPLNLYSTSLKASLPLPHFTLSPKHLNKARRTTYNHADWSHIKSICIRYASCLPVCPTILLHFLCEFTFLLLSADSYLFFLSLQTSFLSLLSGDNLFHCENRSIRRKNDIFPSTKSINMYTWCSYTLLPTSVDS